MPVDELSKTAVRELRRLVGSDHVVDTEAERRQAETATFATMGKVLAVVRPASTEEVQGCLRLAQSERFAIYPVSRGKNWGLGSRVPVTGTAVLLDLSRLNRITHFDPDMAYMTVEPGVTFRQAYEYLRQTDSTLILPITGGSPEGSLIGNVVERGDGVGPYGDRLAHVADFEVVLPDGEVIRTGLSRFESAQAAPLDNHGVGPSLNGLFTQSNLGIVTQLTMWLLPRPEYFRSFTFRLERESNLRHAVETARELMLGRVIEPYGFGLWNSYKVAAVTSRFPWQAAGGRTPLSIRALQGAEPWFGGGAIFAASEEIGRAQLEMVRASLGEGVQEFFEWESRAENQVYFGEPTNANIRSMYWRKPDEPPTEIDPDRDRCGVMWLCIALPLKGDALEQAIGVARKCMLRHRFEPNLGAVACSGRKLHLFAAILYDRDQDGHDQAAQQCHDELYNRLAELGMYPYRLGINGMNVLHKQNDGFSALIRRLKDTLDPHELLAPGRYLPAKDSQPNG